MLKAIKTVYLDPGEYYIGDPCYVVADKDWIPLLESVNPNADVSGYFDEEGNLFKYKGQECWAAGTAYGDGCYLDEDEREYGVDSGLIGIIPISACDPERLESCGRSGGQIITFEKDVRAYYDDGEFHFGIGEEEIVIETN